MGSPNKNGWRLSPGARDDRQNPSRRVESHGPPDLVWSNWLGYRQFSFCQPSAEQRSRHRRQLHVRRWQRALAKIRSRQVQDYDRRRFGFQWLGGVLSSWRSSSRPLVTAGSELKSNFLLAARAKRSTRGGGANTPPVNVKENYGLPDGPESVQRKQLRSVGDSFYMIYQDKTPAVNRGGPQKADVYSIPTPVSARVVNHRPVRDRKSTR